MDNASRRAVAYAAAGLVVTSALVVATTAGGGRALATTTTVTYADPAWSPNGRRIAFVVRRTVQMGPTSSTTAALALMNVDGTGTRDIATVPPGRMAWPSWSPDSRRIAFGYDHLYAVNADGTKLREIGTGCCVAWGPGGRKIAFADGAEVQSSVYVMEPSGRRPRAVAQPDQPHSFWAPTWSPRGQKLAFFSDEAPDQAARASTALAVIDGFGGKVRLLKTGRFAEPAWSPDGRAIAADGIRVLDLRTGRVESLHSGSHPSWSPDSRRIAFADQNQIFVMNHDGSGLRRLTP